MLATNSTIEYGCGVYQGQVTGWWPTRTEHGRGVFCWTNGDRYGGEYLQGERNGRGAFQFGDDSRRFEGSWARDRPLQGTAIDNDGIIYLAEFDGENYISEQWEAGVVPSWERWGRKLHGNLGDEFVGNTAEWAGIVQRKDGTQFEGILRGLCPLGGVETDVHGARFRVLYSGDCTLAEEPIPINKEVIYRTSFSFRCKLLL